MSATGMSMSMSEFMDKQIMDLSKSNRNDDVIDLVDPHDPSTKKEEINPTSIFESIRPAGLVLDRDSHNNTGARVWKSADSITGEVSGIGIKNYGSLGPTGPSKFTIEKDPIDPNVALASEIEVIMRRHTDSLMHALDDLSARLSQFESRSRHIENSVDELKLSMGNNHGTADGRLRQIENVLREVQSNVQGIRDKQDLMDAHIELSKMQISKSEQQSQSGTAASAPESTLPQLPPAAIIPQAPPSFQTINAPPSHILPGHIPPGQISTVPPQGDPYFFPPPPAQIQDATIPPQYQLPPQQNLQPPMLIPPQQQYHQPQESSYPPPPSQTYHSSLQQQQPPAPTKPPSGAPFQQFYDHHLPSNRLGSGFPTSYDPSSGNGDAAYPYRGGPPQYGGDFSKQQLSAAAPHSAQGGGGGYNQLPSARILPKALPTASPVGGGDGSSSGGNRVPVDDVVDKVTSMGFPRDQVRAIVRKSTENGQSVDLNAVLDKLMNDGEGGWYGHR